MPDPTPQITPQTIGERLRLAFSLYPQPSSFTLRDVDRWCHPRLGSGHCAQIVAGKIGEPRRATLREIARVLGCREAWLAEGKGKGPTARGVTAAVRAARAGWEGRQVEAGVAK